MERLVKEKYAYLLIPIIVMALAVFLLSGGGGAVEQTSITNALQKIGNVTEKKNDLSIKQDRLGLLKQQKAAENADEKKESKSGKVIYGVSGEQFTAEASFGIIFENLLANLTNSGVRVRSIEYDYHPADDKILSAGLNGYNVCEISFVSVGSYSQFQNFFKNIAKEKYLSNIYEVYIEPYDKDKTILITRFKIRLYTKTI